MIKQEIVIATTIRDEKKGSKALTTASNMNGVVSVELVRERNQLVVIGVGVDSVELTRSLRKIFGFADIVSVRNVITTREEACFQRYDFELGHHMNINHSYPTGPTPTLAKAYHHQHSYNYIAVPVHDLDPPPMCSIM